MNILVEISMKFISKGPIHNILAAVQVMAWCRSCKKPLFEPMMVRLPTHVCVTRTQWVNNKLARAVPFISIRELNIANNRSWSTVSKAALKSNRTKTTDFFSWYHYVHETKLSNICYFHDSILINKGWRTMIRCVKPCLIGQVLTSPQSLSCC